MAKIPFIGLLELHFLLVLLNEVHIRVPHQMLSVDDVSYKSEGILMGFNWSKLSVVEYMVPTTYLTPVSDHSPFLIDFTFFHLIRLKYQQRTKEGMRGIFSIFAIHKLPIFVYISKAGVLLNRKLLCDLVQYTFGVGWKYQWRKCVSSA